MLTIEQTHEQNNQYVLLVLRSHLKTLLAEGMMVGVGGDCFL